MAYQIAFDMYESAPQQFLWRVIEALRVTAPVPSAAHHIVTVPVEGNTNASAQSTGGASDGASTSIDDDVEKRVENLVRFPAANAGFTNFVLRYLVWQNSFRYSSKFTC